MEQENVTSEELCQAYEDPSPRKWSMWNKSAPEGKVESMGSHRCLLNLKARVQMKGAFLALPLRASEQRLDELSASSHSVPAEQGSPQATLRLQVCLVYIKYFQKY